MTSSNEYALARVGVSETMYVDNEGLLHLSLGNGSLSPAYLIRPLFENLRDDDFNIPIRVIDKERQGELKTIITHNFSDRPLVVGKDGVTYLVSRNESSLVGRPIGSCLGILSKTNAPLMSKAYEKAKAANRGRK